MFRTLRPAYAPSLLTLSLVALSATLGVSPPDWNRVAAEESDQGRE